MVDILATFASAATKGALQNPVVAQNRDRIGAVLTDGYWMRDTIVANKAPLFVVGLIGAGLSGYAMYKRRTGEGYVLYAITGLLSAGLAWAARPWIKSPPAGAPPTPAAAGQSTSALVSYLDRRVNALRGRDPQFAGRSLSRLLHDTSLDKISALTAIVSES